MSDGEVVAVEPEPESETAKSSISAEAVEDVVDELLRLVDDVPDVMVGESSDELEVVDDNDDVEDAVESDGLDTDESVFETEVALVELGVERDVVSDVVELDAAELLLDEEVIEIKEDVEVVETSEGETEVVEGGAKSLDVDVFAASLDEEEEMELLDVGIAELADVDELVGLSEEDKVDEVLGDMSVEKLELAEAEDEDEDVRVDEVEEKLLTFEKVMEDVRLSLEIVVPVKAEVDTVEPITGGVADPLEEADDKIETFEAEEDAFEDDVKVLAASVDEKGIDEPLEDELGWLIVAMDKPVRVAENKEKDGEDNPEEVESVRNDVDDLVIVEELVCGEVVRLDEETEFDDSVNFDDELDDRTELEDVAGD